jgi:glycosyltransferase involved in cell wall biosynthesis
VRSSKPIVSVVIPAYNAGPYIAEAINSVVAQTFTDWELIVVDDGSTDDTAERVAPFLSDPRVSLHRKANGGPSSARNVGITATKADLIAFLDADDYWLPTKLEKQIAVMAKYPDIGVCGTSRRHISENGDILASSLGEEFHGKAFPRLLYGPIADMSMALIRRTVFEKAGLFDESLLLSEDYEFWLRVGRDFCFHIIPEPLACIRRGHTSTSGTWEKRRAYFHGHILPRFLNEQDGRRFAKPWHLWKLKARNYKYRGDEAHAWYASVGWYLRSLVTYPFDNDAYIALGGAVLPWRRSHRVPVCTGCL